jgi:hypothetical protein
MCQYAEGQAQVEFGSGLARLLDDSERALASAAFCERLSEDNHFHIDYLLEALVAAGHYVPPEHFGSVLQLADLDKNGEIDLDEFLELVGFLKSVTVTFASLPSSGGSGQVRTSDVPQALARYGWTISEHLQVVLYYLCDATDSTLQYVAAQRVHVIHVSHFARSRSLSLSLSVCVCMCVVSRHSYGQYMKCVLFLRLAQLLFEIADAGMWHSSISTASRCMPW